MLCRKVDKLCVDKGGGMDTPVTVEGEGVACIKEEEGRERKGDNGVLFRIQECKKTGEKRC